MPIIKTTKENHKKLKKLKEFYNIPLWKIANSILEDGIQRIESGKATVSGVEVNQINKG